MKKILPYLLIFAGAAAILFTMTSFYPVLESFLERWEGFSAMPYWDVSRWAWGYGTRVPGSVDDPGIRPSGTITRAEAWAEATSHINSDYSYLQPLISRTLNPRQWAALLSFSYNLGSGAAHNLVANINTYNDVALGDEWKRYVYSENQVNPDLVKRRAAEWQLWSS
jgi:GH24 family phage-related lysozyme (muramidase)